MLRERLASFGHACAGLATLVREQANARIHLAATLVVVGVGLWLDLRSGEWLAVIICVALVWSAEAMNTALEYLCDLVHPDQHPLIRKAKDVAAGGVLACALAALLVALVILRQHGYP